MILFCPEADTDLTSLSVKITSKNKKIKIRKTIKDFFKSFPYSSRLMLKRNEVKNVYIAVGYCGRCR